MEWLAENPEYGEKVLAVIAFAVTALIIFFGRKKLLVSIPIGLVFLLWAAIAIPSFIPAGVASQRAACIANLKQIRDVKLQWADTNHKGPNDIPTEADLCMTNAGIQLLREFPTCPRGGTYTIGTVRQNPTCSFANKGHRLD